ncbi:hypothetical protein GCM10012279_32040 [Micromonospora yangpuensis]|uniref:Uncharacterized protein n=1 Tax=Micromonospora yangpuensis TaxID=683228 RepID=A0A1C6U0W3_9ACTN|nr:hypothetical protein GCM10012279_32040 [Micromonospora yangpuensis]SCL47627.1 hypothetical protein GA0070617_0640 [Micromonospora yangpuensis]
MTLVAAAGLLAAVALLRRSGRITGRVAGRVTGRAAGRVTGRAAGRVTGRAAGGIAGRCARWRDRRRERRTIARLDRAFEADALTRDIDLTEFDRPDRRPVEQAVAHLRRLGENRVAPVGRTVVWNVAVVEAYDTQLRTVCRALGIAEHLGELTGFDREIERVRVEGLLHRAGFPLPATQPEHHQRHH